MTGDFDDDYDRGNNRSTRVLEESSGDGLRRAGSLITGLLTICLLLLVAAGAAYFYVDTVFNSPGPLSEEQTVTITRGQGVREIADTLMAEGAISDDRVFILGVLAHQANDSLKAGEYRFPAHASMSEIMAAIVAGRSVQYAITIPEGLTTRQIVERIEEDPVLVGEITQVPAEGSLLPDTYAFTRGASRQDMIGRMVAAQKKLMDELWPTRDENLPIEKPYEALILASIVEKETGVAAERPQVASVFVNRLRRGMRLQSDPTIIYGIVGGEGSLGRPITRSDINSRTPYNTYQIDGLPPTPIANPGRDAIAAVLKPEETDYVYFVADGTGGHAFAETLVEHNANVAEWRKIERARRLAEQAEAEASEAADIANDADTVDPAALATTPDADDAGDAAASETETAATEPEAPGEADAAIEEPADDAATEAADTAGDDAVQEPDAGSREYPLPEPKPPVPQRATSSERQSDVTVVPLPATTGDQ